MIGDYVQNNQPLKEIWNRISHLYGSLIFWHSREKKPERLTASPFSVYKPYRDKDRMSTPYTDGRESQTERREEERTQIRRIDTWL